MGVLRLAWRNIWRNRKRTGITVAAITLNTAVLITTFALMQGMYGAMLDNATRLVTGDAQVHMPHYRVDRSLYNAIANPEQVLEVARRAGIQAAPRAYGFGLVSSGAKSAGAMFWGVDPGAERAAFKLARSVDRGTYLADQPAQGVVLGSKLARSLHAELGSEIVAVVQAADGSLGNEIFRVTGVLKICGEEIDRGAAIIHRQDFDALFVSGGRVHEIALNAWGRLAPEQVKAAVQGSVGSAQVRTWRELMPQLGNMVEMAGAAIWIFGVVFFLAAALGVMNTMLMATYERIREFGVQKALGASPFRILRDVCAEALVLALVSTAAALVIALPAAFLLQEHGLDLTWFGSGSMTFTGIAFDPIWRASLSGVVVVQPILVMWVVCVLAALYPAAKAARLDPVRAMGHT